jgi:acylphosphatase
MSAARFHVSGRVQGVSYRASARAKAHELGLAGYARNLPDGRVEVLAVGAAESIDVFESWLWRGPAFARVSKVERSALEVAPAAQGFLVL